MTSSSEWREWLRDRAPALDLGVSEQSMSTELRRRIRIISLATMAMCFAGLVSSVQFWRLQMMDTALYTTGTVALGLFNLWLLRATRRSVLCGHFAMGMLTAIIVITSIAVGGYYSPSFSWFYVIPLAASVIVGPRGALVWTGIAASGMLGFWLLPELGIQLPNRIPPELQHGNALFSRMLAILAIGALGAGFVNSQRRAEKELARVNDWHRTEAAFLELVMHATVCANEATSFESAMRESVERICQAMGWFGGHICTVNDDGTIVSSGFFHLREPGRYEPLREETAKRVRRVGEGIAGRAVQKRSPEYVTNVAELKPEGRAPMAREMGFRSALAVPIFVDGEIPAVLEFASSDDLPDPDQLVEVFTHIGVQLGRVAERAARQESLRQAQKMEAVGQLAAGIAHEINNPMSYVRSNLRSLREEWAELAAGGFTAEKESELEEQLAEFREMIDDSLDGVERTIQIVRRLSEYSHTGADRNIDWKTNDLCRLLDGARRVAAAHAPSGVTFETALVGGATCFCSANQITQVLVNLILNAIQAVGERGTIRLACGCDDAEVFVRVEDDGSGMTEATRERLFDPFFTTKRVGEGTGLGLSVSYEIVRSHQGEIRVQSEAGKGAVFEVRLPAAS